MLRLPLEQAKLVAEGIEKDSLGEKLQLNLNPGALMSVWRAIDENGSGSITFAEFSAAIFPDKAVDIPDGDELDVVGAGRPQHQTRLLHSWQLSLLCCKHGCMQPWS